MNKKILQAKRKHHHVWADYLKRWSINNRDVYYTTSKGKIVCESVRGIAVEKDFYRTSPLTGDDIEFIKRWFSKFPLDIQELHQQRLDEFIKIQVVRSLIKANGQDNELTQQLFLAQECNMIEDIHSSHENSAWPILNALASGNLDVLNDDKNMILFTNFFGHQITRTKNFKDSVFNGNSIFPSDGDTNLCKRNWWFISHMFGTNIGQSLFFSRRSNQHSLLLNETNIPFITSDQPIINVHEGFKLNSNEPPKHADFYYPISPSTAYLIQESATFPSGLNSVSIEQVNELNKKIARHPHNHLFSKNAETLNPLLKTAKQK